MKIQSQQFIARSREGINNEALQGSLSIMSVGMPLKRQMAIDSLGNFEQHRQYVKQMKDHTLANMADYLEQFESHLLANGGQLDDERILVLDGDEAPGTRAG